MVLYLIASILFSLLFLLYAFKMIKFINSAFEKYENMHKLCNTLSTEDPFFPFSRSDFPHWSKLKFYLGAIFLLPIRLILSIFCLLFCFFFVKLVLLNADLDKPIIGFRKYFLKFFVSYTCRFLLFIAGIYRIRILEEKIENYMPNYRPNLNSNSQAPIIVSNHVSWIDTLFYLSSTFFPSFVAKEEVSFMPIVGYIAKTIQVLFVDRESRGDKDLILKKIKERCMKIKQQEGLPQLLIFPEGTNNNQKTIVNFKKGAFSSFDKIQIIALEYPYQQFNIMMDHFGMGMNIILSMCIFKHNMVVHVFDVFDPMCLNLKKEEEWETYATTIQDIMAKCLKIKRSKFGIRDSLAFTEFLKEHKIIKDEKIDVNEISPNIKIKKI